MNLEQIKKALEKGLKVYWENDGYEVLKDKLGRYLVVFKHNGFWYPMDTIRDKEHLENLWRMPNCPWKS